MSIIFADFVCRALEERNLSIKMITDLTVEGYQHGRADLQTRWNSPRKR